MQPTSLRFSADNEEHQQHVGERAGVAGAVADGEPDPETDHGGGPQHGEELAHPAAGAAGGQCLPSLSLCPES